MSRLNDLLREVRTTHPVLARELEDIFEQQATPQRAWQLSIKDGDLSWTDGQETFDSDPKASAGRRFQAWFARTFHLDAQL